MQYGRDIQKVQVCLQWKKQTAQQQPNDNQQSRILDWIEGCRKTKTKTLKVEKDVYIICDPEVPHHLDSKVTFIEDLGLVEVQVKTQRLALGGNLVLKMSLIDTPPHFQFTTTGFSVDMVQSVRLQSRQKRSFPFHYSEPKRIPLLHLDGKKEEGVQTDKMTLNGEWTLPIPTCDTLRPSTLAGSKQAAIRITHHLEISITYLSEQCLSEPLTHTFEWPIILASVSSKRKSDSFPLLR
jgi:hypothetical protein